MDESPLVIFLMGPTASGKTELALSLYRQYQLGLINVDASQIYTGMDIGTAKPDRALLKQVPHSLIDIRDPAESYSAADFRQDALGAISAIIKEGKTPLLVGGTIFYFHALEYGLSPLPPADPELRAEITKEAEDVGWPQLHERIAAIDHEAAKAVHPHDGQRIQRLIELYQLTGEPPSQLRARQQRSPLPFRILKLAIFPEDREVLHRRIEDRFDLMLREGLIDEVRMLRERKDLSMEMPAMKMVGYRQVWEHLEGFFGYNEMRLRAIAATRQLAKRQITWLRKYQGAEYVDGDNQILVQKASCEIDRAINK